MANSEPEEVRPSEAERAAFAYWLAAQADTWAALVWAVEDALADLELAERLLRRQEGHISHGYVRGQLSS
ncbi:hypothetical protein MOX02_18870 [Methylobacterium oxalidis]|uniref:Uncharacterized protein n=1 Tax=Methylobacterium oxalidis TaxID=944322 RepID=A0A512J1W0_9HYPH|nr:hypothetical protein MOX02_18870 [Methylobacterium oxalidis]GJE31277.1 hypothetical protein LDDCCGHA_1454 [Methylobacterium oxalidis]GLS65293.1 hypothetical protein GCM10007888_36750 [Methylobacterium oxalidis]